MRVALLGFTLPEEQMREVIAADPAMPIQTDTFARNLLEALQTGGAEVRLLSCAPVSSYPGNPQILFHGGRFEVQGAAGRRLPFVNLLGAKHVTRFLSCLLQGTHVLRRQRPHTLLIHGVHSPFLWYGVLARRLVGSRTVVVVTDPPGVVLPSDSALVSRLKRLDAWLVRQALSRVDGVVTLTSALATDYAPDRPHLVMEGMLGRAGTDRAGRPVAGSGARLMYAGGLTPAYGVDRLVSAVRGLPDTVRLAVYGKGSLTDWVEGQAREDARIDPPRFATRAEVLQQYADVDLLVQPRPVDQHFVRYSFPSKLLEYMASGTPVLTTRLSGIPSDYSPYVYWIDDDSIEGMQAAIAAVLATSTAERRSRGVAAAEFVARTRSTTAQGVRLVSFLGSLAEVHPPGR